MDFILFISIIISTIKCIKNFELGLRDIILKNRILMFLHYNFIKILISEENEDDIYTCRKIVKKEA